MMRPIIASTLVLAAAAAPAALFAQPPTQQQVKAAHDATLAAKDVTVAIIDHGASVGTVNLHQIGRTRSRVTIHMTKRNELGDISLVPGSYCNGNRGAAAAAAAVPLSAFNAASATSQTIVALPLSDLASGNYALRVRHATQQQAMAETCARIAGR